MDSFALTRLWRSRVLALVAVVAITSTLAVMPTVAASLRQDSSESTPELDVPIGENAQSAGSVQATQDPVVTPTAVVGSASGPPPTATEAAQPAASATETVGPADAPVNDPGQGIPVLAQGLIYLNGDAVFWHVRQVELGSSNDAPSVTGNARVILQRSGVSIIRNDLTGKRARLEEDEAFFASAGDPYTAIADGDASSVVWIFEISNSDEVGDGAFYLSPNVSGYDEAVYDMEFSRFLLQPGATVDLPQQDGPALVVVVTGSVNVTSTDGETELSTQEALTVREGATITASDGGQVELVTMTVGPEVSDDTAAPPPVPASTPVAAADTDSVQDTQPEEPATGPDAVEPPSAPSSDASNLDPAGDEDGDYMTNGDEIALGLDPFDPDTDGDRLLDGQEASDFGTDPFVLDSDGDGLIDGHEYDTYGTDPAVWDSDGDGAGDGDEIDAGTDPLDAGSVP
jgi:hypothetical protein